MTIKTPPYGSRRWVALQQYRARWWRKKYPKGKISKYFRWDEFLCKDMYRSVPPIGAHDALVKLCRQYLDPLRAQFGPCHVMSGYRPRPYNDAIPGAAGQSQHIYEDTPGEVAADLVFDRGTPAMWAREAREIRNKLRHGGVGDYPSFVHVDNRLYVANW